MPQNLITNPMYELDLIDKERAMAGICGGLAAAFVIASLSGNLMKFLTTIEYLESQKQRAESVSQKIKTFKTDFMHREGIKDERLFEKTLVEKYECLSSAEKLLTDCLALFKTISILQDPETYPRYFLKKIISQGDLEAISKIILHKSEKNNNNDLLGFYCRSLNKTGGIKQVYRDEMINTSAEWCGVFEECRQILEKIGSKNTDINHVVCFTFNIKNNSKHKITFYYDADDKNWIVTDANDLPTYNLQDMDEEDAVHLTGKKTVAKNLPKKALYKNGFLIDIQQNIFTALKEKEFLSGSIEVYTTSNNKHLKETKKAFAKLKQNPKSYLPPVSELLTRKGSDDTSLLYAAILKDDVVNLKKYTELGVDLTQENQAGYSPLYYASLYNSKKCMNYFLKAKKIQDLNQVTTDKDSEAYLETPACIAAYNNNFESLEMLANAGALLEKPMSFGFTPLHIAARRNSLDALKILIKPEYHVGLNNRTIDGHTALHEALLKKKYGAIKMLLDAKADANVTSREDGLTPLHIAAARSSKEVKLLVQGNKHIDLNKENANGETPAMIATHTGNIESLKVLVEYGADVSIPDKSGLTTLKVASMNKRDEVVKFLKTHAFFKSTVSEIKDVPQEDEKRAFDMI